MIDTLLESSVGTRPEYSSVRSFRNTSGTPRETSSCRPASLSAAEPRSCEKLIDITLQTVFTTVT
jgi:hypothetical protein